MPYAGVVVQRNINRGDLVLPANTGGKPLFVVGESTSFASSSTFPKWMLPGSSPGQKGTIVVPSLGGRRIEGTVTRTSRALGPNRTLLTELDIPNPERLLEPGMYVMVEIMLAGAPRWNHPAAFRRDS